MVGLGDMEQADLRHKSRRARMHEQRLAACVVAHATKLRVRSCDAPAAAAAASSAIRAPRNM